MAPDVDALEEDFSEFGVKFVTSLTDPGQPYSTEQWQTNFGSPDAPLVVDENMSSAPMFSLFHDSWNAFPTFALLDHTMTVRAKPWTLSSNSNTSSCDGSNATINGWSGGNTFNFIQQLVDECGSLCEECSGTTDSDGDGIADECDDCNNMSGDLNDDMTIDILDIVSVVNLILSGESSDECQINDADMDSNGTVNILDVIQIINIVLGSAREAVDGSVLVSYDIIGNDLLLKLSSDISITGLELAFASDYLLNIEDDNTNLYTATALDNDIQRYIAFSMENISFSDNSIEITLRDGGLLDIEDIHMIVSSSQGTQVPVVWDVAEIKSFELSQLQPNPFNPTTQVLYDVHKSGNMQLAVYNILGQKIATLHEGFIGEGSHMFTWDAGGLSSGIYYVTMIMDGHAQTMKAVLVK